MIPKDINVDALAEQLTDSDVVANQAALDTLGEHAESTLQHVQSTVDTESHPEMAERLGETKVVLLKGSNLTRENSRDIAQAIKDRTDADTVLVQTTQSAGAVSDGLTRYIIENNEPLVAGSLDPADTQAFVSSAADAHSYITPVNAVALIAVLVAIPIGAISTKLALRSR